MHVQGSSHGARLPDDRYLFYVRHEGRQNPGTVAVFESGLGGTRSYWAATQQLLAGELTTVAYDRAGLGRSSPTQHYSLPHRAADLTALLDHVLRPGQKAILVGHSWGGPIIRVAAAARPARIAGLILVDPTDEACDLYFSKAARRLERLGLLLSVPMAITGLNRLGARTFLSRFPDEAAADMRAEAFTVAAARAYRGELRTLSRDLASLKQTRPDPKASSPPSSPPPSPHPASTRAESPRCRPPTGSAPRRPARDMCSPTGRATSSLCSNLRSSSTRSGARPKPSRLTALSERTRVPGRPPASAQLSSNA